MDTMEITKIVGAACGSLLIFLLIQTASDAIFWTESEEVAYLIEVPEDAAGGEETPEEEVDVEALLAEADASAGETVFRRCAACHKVDGSNAVGPHLDGVFGRDIAAVEGYSYSDTLGGLEGDWDAESLYHFIGNPREYAPGTSMAFAGLPQADDRADVIAYLQAVSN